MQSGYSARSSRLRQQRAVLGGPRRSWLGGVYMLIAAIASVRESHVWGISLEVALHESEERFRLLVDQTKDHAIFMLDPDGRVVTWNSGAQSVKGYTESEIIGRQVLLLCSRGR